MSHAAAIPLDPSPAPAAGPDRRADPAGADAFVTSLAQSHYENFPVLTRLVPPPLRPDFAAVYAYCRTCDDLADETGVGPEARTRSLHLLARWRTMLNACFEHATRPAPANTPSHPVFTALSHTIKRHELPPEPFHHLIDAFEQDQRVTRYESWDQLLDYCTRSADPVGRIVLRLAGRRPTDHDWHELVTMSDATCTALQLTNFWQDVRRDLVDRDRVYLPAADTGITEQDLRAWLDDNRPTDAGANPGNRIRYIRALRELVHRTRPLFERGRPLPHRLSGPIARVVWLFGAGGEHVLNRIERAGCTTLWHRPVLTKPAKALLLLSASFRRFSPDRAAATARP